MWHFIRNPSCFEALTAVNVVGMQDPTGSIGTAFHGSVLQQQQYQQGRLVPGTVVLLQQVSVFTPAPGVSYLAVTATNIVKVGSGRCCDAARLHPNRKSA